ncbi:MAG TPA: hypothetical protein VNA89_06300, partial [Gemmatimonadaceae bacterium]|nr:hypothetical protein [Gemmatimonadaceae bacterium]
VGQIKQPADRRTAESLDKTRNLVRGLESLRERTRQAGEQQGQQQGQQGGQGGQSQAGQPGRGQLPSRSQIGGGGQGAAIGGGGGALTPEQIRQLSREYRERRESAEALRRELRRQGVDAEGLDQLIGQLRALEGAGAYGDAQELERLQGAVIDGFKAFEFALRRRLAGGEEAGPLLGGVPDVPPDFRALVEEYYRSLGRGQRP